MIEIGISIAALVGIFIAGLSGVQIGLFRSLARFLVVALALLVAMRFWYLATDWLSESLNVAPEQLAFAVFWGLFALLAMPLLALLKSLNQDFVPIYPVVLERFFGFVLGAAGGVLIAAGVLLSVMLNLPQFYPTFDESKMILPLHRMPDVYYRTIETRLVGTQTDQATRTLLPGDDRKVPTDPLRVSWK